MKNRIGMEWYNYFVICGGVNHGYSFGNRIFRPKPWSQKTCSLKSSHSLNFPAGISKMPFLQRRTAPLLKNVQSRMRICGMLARPNAENLDAWSVRRRRFGDNRISVYCSDVSQNTASIHGLRFASFLWERWFKGKIRYRCGHRV